MGERDTQLRNLMTEEALTPDEELVMKECFVATMLRAATILDGLSQADVEEAQTILFLSGCTVQQVARIDRAMLGASYLRACAAGVSESGAERVKILRESLVK